MSNLLNIRTKKPFEIKCAKDSDRAEVLIYGAIGNFWGDSISAKDFTKALKDLPDSVKNLDIRVNSPGGDVFDGFAIYNVLKRHKAKKTVYIDGMAFSIASIIALAGDEIVMGEGSQYMVHLPWTYAAGNKVELMATIERLESIEDELVGIYHRRTKLDRNEIRDYLAKETFFTASEAVELGFADRAMEDEEHLNIAACSIDKAYWIRNKPKMENGSDAIKDKITGLKSNIEGFLAR